MSSLSNHEKNATIDKNWTAECVTSCDPPPAIDTMTWIMVIADGAILSIGLIGNVLVIYVVARYARMKTVTNVYILNLSIADSLFLVGMPMIMTTALLRRWVFGAVLCHVFFALTCVNMFTGAFTLMLMSADRFAAVWFPVSSVHYRTPSVAAAAAAMAWIISGALMSPVVLYQTYQAIGLSDYHNGLSCSGTIGLTDYCTNGLADLLGYRIIGMD